MAKPWDITGDDITIWSQRVGASAVQKLLRPSKPFVGLSYDALQYFVPNSSLLSWGVAWHATA